ncbi:hypothetical protein [Chryseolinea lacunae]|uniref:AsmA-like C-terminal domain-containing protein n=1 Tax=Chryseolinea lacunae TaxID=2801331 RepID=A0ABS1KLX0_9BACT|nr:hypothetical protein [Chryseolinea lacunae]MBL0740454.1 hypothetical protein [Chryseolinea lacunae]
MKKKIILVASIVIVLVVISVVAFRYYNLINFKDSLTELVETKTHGQYKLVIGKAKMDLSKLHFELKNVSLVKTEKADAKGVESVTIPLVEAEAGSLRSLLRTGQMVIEKLAIEEPVLKMTAGSPDSTQHREQVAHSLVKIFPAIEAVLDKFLIKSFTLRRGAVHIEKEGQHMISLSLIDFMVRDWNMKQLSDSSQIRLNLKGQQMMFGKTNLSFSEIEFKYPEHFLEFHDLVLESADTVSHSKIKIEGKSVLIQGLDYQELYAHQRYKLKKIHIQQPRITGSLHLDGKAHKVKHPIKEILEQVFGEAHLDSAILSDADIDLTLHHYKDSIKTHLPHVDLALSNFEVRPDTSSLLVDGLRIDLNETSIKLNNNVTLHCDDLLFLRGHFLSITHATLVDNAANKVFMECERVDVSRFGLIDFVFSRKLHLASLTLENADITITPHYLNLFPKLSAARRDTTQTKKKTLDMNIGGLHVKHANIRYADGKKNMILKDASLDVGAFTDVSLSTLRSKLAYFRAGSVLYDNPKDSTHLQVKGLLLSKTRLSLGALDLKWKTFMAVGQSLSINDYVFDTEALGRVESKTIRIESLAVKGRLPAGKVHKPATPKKNISLVVNDVQIGKLEADVHMKDQHIAFNAKELSGRGIRFQEGKMHYQHVIGRIDNIHYQKPETDVRVASMDFDFFGKSRITNAKVHHKNHDIALTSAMLGEIKLEDHATTVAYVTLAGTTVQQDDQPLFTTDSVSLRGIVLPHEKSPHIGAMFVYRPIIHLHAPSPAKKEKTKSSKPLSTDVVDKFAAYDGTLTTAKGQTFRFTKLHGSLTTPHRSVRLEGGKFDTEKAVLRVDGLDVEENKIAVKLFTITPQDAYVKNLNVSASLLTGELHDIALTGFNLDSLLERKKLVAQAMNVDRFALHISKDKQLPSGTLKDKPFLLHEMMSPAVHVKQLNVREGFIQYRETSDKTHREGVVELHKINLAATSLGPDNYLSDGMVLNASTRLYDKGEINLKYTYLSPTQFGLKVDLKPFDLTVLNQIIVPAQALEIRSGYLEGLQFDVIADRNKAVGNATMSYKNLHLEIFSKNDPEKKNLGSSLLTLLADGIVLRHNKENATAPIEQERIATKSVFSYWVKIATHGAMNVVRHGKSRKNVAAASGKK